MALSRTLLQRGVWWSYMWSVTVATMTLVGLVSALKVVSGLGRFETLSDLFRQAAVLGVVAVGTWTFTFIAALIPFVASVGTASRFNIRSGWYYAACGILTAMLIAPAVEYLGYKANSLDPIEYREPWQLSELVWTASLFIIAGLSGAMTYWWKKGRFLDTETS